MNYGKELNAIMEHDCELNSEKASVDPDHVTRNDSFTYYEMMGAGKKAETCKGKIFQQPAIAIFLH